VISRALYDNLLKDAEFKIFGRKWLWLNLGIILILAREDYEKPQ
jgi:hypothetical protein